MMFSNGNIRFALIVLIIVLAVFLVNRILKQYSLSTKKQTLINWLTIGVTLTIFISLDNWAAKKYGDQIGGFFEIADYKAKYYVNVFENNKTSKNYQLPAEIYREEERGEYQLNVIYWPNGGTVKFYDSAPYHPLKLNDKVEVVDDEGKTWYVELTKKRVNLVEEN